jgi:tetratricopeptide (TPR) repeat protein
LNKPLFQKTFTHLVLIILLSLIAYSNTFHVPFHFDDKPVIVENPIIKDFQYFTSPSKAKVFTEHFRYDTLRRRYIGYLTFALNYSIHGLDTTGYHIVNLVIHICTAMLVYLLVHFTFQTPLLLSSKLRDYSQLIALFSALLFACHPIQTQAVTFIWQRVSSLSTMLYLLSLVAYIKWKLTRHNNTVSEPHRFISIKSISLYLISIISAVFAMKTKETAFMLPVMVTLYESIFFQGKKGKRILYLIPLLLTMLIIPLTLINIDKPLGDLIGDISDETKGATTLSRGAYLLTSFRVITTYIRLIFLPINQNLDYDYPTYSSFFNIDVVLSFLFLLFIFGTGVFLLHRYRHTAVHIRLISFGIFWFFINLLLESSIIPLNNVIFEHRVYLPSIGISLVLSTVCFIILKNLENRGKRIEYIMIPMFFVIIMVLTGATYARNTVWKNEITLWQDVLSKSPNKERAHNGLANAYMNSGLIDKAIEQWEHALKLNTTYGESLHNLGIAYGLKGNFNAAVESLLTTITLFPYNSEAHYNLAKTYNSLGKIDNAINHYKTAIDIKPNFSEAHNNLGFIYQSMGLLDKAIEHHQQAIKFKPDNSEAYNNLGNAFWSQGNIDNAIEQYQIAKGLKPYWIVPHLNLGLIYFEKGDIEKARKEFKIVLQINPQNQEAQKFLNLILYRKK